MHCRYGTVRIFSERKVQVVWNFHCLKLVHLVDYKKHSMKFQNAKIYWCTVWVNILGIYREINLKGFWGNLTSDLWSELLITLRNQFSWSYFSFIFSPFCRFWRFIVSLLTNLRKVNIFLTWHPPQELASMIFFWCKTTKALKLCQIVP